jgi:hypothetical protein
MFQVMTERAEAWASGRAVLGSHGPSGGTETLENEGMFL